MPPPTKHVQELCDSFLNAAFPQASEPQKKDLRMTFFAGAFAVIECINKSASDSIPEQHGVAMFFQIEKEVLDTCEEIATLGRARN